MQLQLNNTPQNTKRHRNPLDSYGNISRCRICESINHWEEHCPDKPDHKLSNTAEITLFQSVLHTQETLQHFTGESFGTAVFDSGASKTVCSETWMNCYKETLSIEDQNSITSEPSSTYFKFGDGRKVPSIMKVTIPATIGGQKVSIRTNIVKEEIPLLPSKESMKKANTHIDFANDKVTMFGNQQDLLTTSFGHYAVSISERARID